MKTPIIFGSMVVKGRCERCESEIQKMTEKPVEKGFFIDKKSMKLPFVCRTEK